MDKKLATLLAMYGDFPTAYMLYKTGGGGGSGTGQASGPIATFETTRSANLKALSVAIDPVQAGSGDPSPENVRQISGWTGVTVYRSGADTSDPAEYSVTFPSDPGTVYGGTLDVVSGVLTVDRAMVDLGTLSWAYNSAQLSMVSSGMASAIGDGANVLCSLYKTETNLQGSQWGGFDKVVAVNKASCITTGNFAYGAIVIKDTAYTDSAIFKAAMSGVQLVYELATPLTYNLTPTQIKTLVGTNNVWSDAGDVDVTYRR